MNLKIKNSRFYFYFITLILTLVGCGYRFASLAPESIQGNKTCLIKEIVVNNKTLLPGIEDKVMYILNEELIRRGCLLNNEHGTSIYALVRDFSMTVQAERGDQIALYEIIIRIEFNIPMPDGNILSKTLSSPFITDFRSGARIEDILLARDKEIDKSIRDISAELIDEYISFLRRD